MILPFENRLKDLKRKILNEIDGYSKWLCVYNDTENFEYENLSLTSYDGLKQVCIQQNKVMEFDENLQIAKAKIDRCFEQWTDGARVELKAVIDRYFRVGKKGFIDKNNILGLFQLNIDEPMWKEAMELIKASISESTKKEYLLLKIRTDTKTEWQTINLNFNSVEVN